MATRAHRRSRPDEAALAPTGVIAPTPIQVESAAFVGSLAMLFACVREGKVDLAEIPLLPVCAAYCRYLEETREVDLDEAAVALAALAYLLERKAWGMLPTPEPEPTEEAATELPAPTMDEFLPAIVALREGLEERARRFSRQVDSDPGAYGPLGDLGGVSAADLARAFEALLRKSDPDPYEIAGRPLPPLADQMAKLLLALGDRWQPLAALLPERFTRLEAVWSFLAILELVRLGRCRVRLFGGEVRFAASAQGTPPRSEPPAQMDADVRTSD